MPQPTNADILELTAPQVAERLAAGEPTTLVDVREPWEVALGTLPGAHAVPLGAIAHNPAAVPAPAGSLVVTYCHHGVRSLRAAALLRQAGVTQVASMAGGTDAWSLAVDPSLARY